MIQDPRKWVEKTHPYAVVALVLKDHQAGPGLKVYLLQTMVNAQQPIASAEKIDIGAWRQKSSA
jgi:hypothetical protein